MRTNFDPLPDGPWWFVEKGTATARKPDGTLSIPTDLSKLKFQSFPMPHGSALKIFTSKKLAEESAGDGQVVALADASEQRLLTQALNALSIRSVVFDGSDKPVAVPAIWQQLENQLG